MQDVAPRQLMAVTAAAATAAYLHAVVEKFACQPTHPVHSIEFMFIIIIRVLNPGVMRLPSMNMQ